MVNEENTLDELLGSDEGIPRETVLSFFDFVGHMDRLGGAPPKYGFLHHKTFDLDYKWVDRLIIIAEELEGMELAGNVNELDYVYHLEYAFRESIRRGSLHNYKGHIRMKENSIKLLLNFRDYIEKSAQSLGVEVQKPLSYLEVQDPNSDNFYTRELNRKPDPNFPPFL